MTGTRETTEHYAAIVDRFEARVFEQEAIEPAHYDDDYFASDWREGDNRYDLETRRRIEARNPQLIKGGRRKRIAQGSGRQVHEVNELLNQFKQMQKMMKMMTGGGRMPGFPGLPPGMGGGGMGGGGKPPFRR